MKKKNKNKEEGDKDSSRDDLVIITTIKVIVFQNSYIFYFWIKVIGD